MRQRARCSIARKVLGVTLVADNEPPKILEPGTESLDLPPPSVATQRATVLGPRCSCFAVRGDQFHATAGQVGIQAVRLVGVVPDETHRERLDKPLREGCVDQGDFVRRGTLNVNRDGESAAISSIEDSP
jgi:hypothetical protein